MRIGIDIDDTISKTSELLIKRAIIYDKEHVKGRGLKDPDAYELMNMFYWNVLDVDNFMNTVRNGDFFLKLEPKEEASKYINKLKEEGHEIYLITRRKDSFKVKYKTKKWLKANGFKYNKIIFAAIDKGNVCKTNDISLFIDNDAKNIKEATEQGINSILMSDRYNKDEKKLKRFDNWTEIYQYISGVK